MEPVTTGATKDYLEGPPVHINEDYGGLGAHFLETLSENLSKVHQIDTVTGVTETNGSVRSRAIQVAHELRHFGVAENDIILICSRSHADQTVVVLACLLIGSIVAPLDSEFHHKEFAELVGQLKPKMCFCDLRTLKQLERVCTETGITSQMVHFGDKQQYAIAFRKFMLNRQCSEQFKPVVIKNPRKKVAFILATQGTTGVPKLVCLSHHFIYSQVTIFLQLMNAPEKILSFYPLSCLMQVILMCLCFKQPVIRVLNGAFVARTACKLIHDLAIDHAFFHTDLALQLVDDVAVKDFNLSCLKMVFIGTVATFPQEVKKIIHRLPCVKVTQLYCTTELGVSIACPIDQYEKSIERIGTVGKVVQNCKIRIVDMDTREDVDEEVTGELIIASDCMMLGYYKNISVTKSCTQSGYFKTGDIAKYDSNGWIFIEGRKSDLITLKGFNELPRELENIILMHPHVDDAAIISNEKEVVACVTTKADCKLDEHKLLKFIMDRQPMFLPTRILFMTDFPTTPLGKIRRDLLKHEVFTVKIEHSLEHVGEQVKI